MEAVQSEKNAGQTRSKSVAALRSLMSPSSKLRSSPDKRPLHAHSNSLASNCLLANDNSARRGLPMKIDHPVDHASRRLEPCHNRDAGSPRKQNMVNSNTKLDKQKTQTGGQVSRDKENLTPPTSSHQALPVAGPPIWAQFASQRPQYEDGGLNATRIYTAESSYQPAKSSDQVLPSNVEQFPLVKNSQNANAQKTDSLKNPQADNSSPAKRGSRVMSTVALFNNRNAEAKKTQAPNVEGKKLEEEFEAVLNARNIPEHMRQNMRALDDRIKREFIRHNDPQSSQQNGEERSKQTWMPWKSKSSTKADEPQAEDTSYDDVPRLDSPTKRGRSRGRAFTLGKGEKSPFKRPRSNSRPRSLMSLKNLSSSSIVSLKEDGFKESQEASNAPETFIEYLKAQKEPQKTEVGRIHRLRILLRTVSIAWTDAFITKGGMSSLIELLQMTMAIEWREEHEDMVMHEILLCLKGLSTTDRAQVEISKVAPVLFPQLLSMLFDEERKGPSEFNTRGVIISLLWIYLTSTPSKHRESRSREILKYLADPSTSDDEQPADFIKSMHQSRPYTKWNKEVLCVGKEVFWIFLHHINVISLTNASSHDGDTYTDRHFPRERPPVPAAPYVGGVEWEATQYITTHLDLMNGLIASLPTLYKRNKLRKELRASGFERTMGETLRLCKEKFYGYVHDALRVWILAGIEDDWQTKDVRMGKSTEEEESNSPSKSPKKQDDLPRLELAQQFDRPDVPGGWL